MAKRKFIEERTISGEKFAKFLLNAVNGAKNDKILTFLRNPNFSPLNNYYRYFIYRYGCGNRRKID